MNALQTTCPAGALTDQLKKGLLLDRAATNQLLNKLIDIESNLPASDQPATNPPDNQLARREQPIPGLKIMIGQLRSILARKDWLRISITGTPENMAKYGANIGIAEARYVKPKTPAKNLGWWNC